ncbi:MAG TPA: hypothetical protein VLA09_10860 [Longimicrobiales bacterium]|nr:hypothetical protein [Longimicrobiales bacterium]
MNVRALVLGLGLALVGVPASAQSIFNSAGIGLPMEGLDGRARALGSFGIGLPGASITPTDPAAAARVFLPAGLIVAQPTWVELDEEGGTERRKFRGTRFPLLGIAYPVFRGTMTLHMAAVFDQSYRGERAVDVELGGVTTPARDVFEQTGSVSSLSLGYARLLNPATAVGVSVGRYVGTVDRSLVRDYGETSVGQVEDYQSSGSWSYAGESVTGGVSTEIFGAVQIGASATLSTDLSADPTGSTEGGERSFQVPLQLRIGASSVLSPGLSLSASAVRADWSGTSDEIGSSSSAGSVTGFGVGMELSQVRLLGRVAPVRVGFRRTGLPFSIGGADASERVFSGGLALLLNEAEGIVLATTDFAVERGRRSAGSFSEDFWRGTVSLRLSGF